MSARTPSSSSAARPAAKSARTKRVRQGASAASSANVSSASGSRSIPISSPVGPEPAGDEARVARRAERAVDRDLAGLRIERLDQLAGEDRDVGLGHVKQDGQVMR